MSSASSGVGVPVTWPQQCVFMTGITQHVDSFLPGVRCLIKRLREVSSHIPLVVATTRDNAGSVRSGVADISPSTNVTVLEWGHFPTPQVRSPHRGHLARWHRSHVYDKLNVFGAFQYRRIVWLDTDILLLQNVDTLCDLPDHVDFAAALNAGFEPRTCWSANGSYMTAEQCRGCRHHGVHQDELARSKHTLWALREQAAGKRDELPPCLYEFNTGTGSTAP